MVYHTGVELDGAEYTFAGTGTQSTGVFSHRPRQLPAATPLAQTEQGWKFKQTVDLGPCPYSKQDVKEMITYLSSQFLGNTYHVTSRNCNHFSQAVCTQLGVTLPQWINMAANVGEAVRGVVGDGMFSQQKPANAPGSGTGAGAACVAGPVLVDLFNNNNVELGVNSSVTCLNEDSEFPVRNIYPSSNQDSFLQSDCDEQLLIFIPFRNTVALRTVRLLMPTETNWNKAPKKVKIFKNRPNLDFSNLEDGDEKGDCEYDIAAQQIIGNKGIVKVDIPLSAGLFRDVTALSIFIESNHGAAVSRLHGVNLLGMSKEGMDVRNLAKAGG